MNSNFKLDDSWLPDASGVLSRQAARVIIFNACKEVLLIRGHDFSDASHSWWFSIGGGLENNETARQGACRELFEETGLSATPSDLIGPVLLRHADFDFAAIKCRQHEQFFLLHLGDMPELCFSGQTVLERELLDEYRWFSLKELQDLEANGETIYPLDLPRYAYLWSENWDGSCPEIWEGTKKWKKDFGDK